MLWIFWHCQSLFLKSQVYPSVQALLEQYMVSSNAGHHRVALMILGTYVEGIAAYLFQTNIAGAWAVRVVNRGLADGDIDVHKAACRSTIGCPCEHHQDDCAARYAVLMPAILKLLSDPPPRSMLVSFWTVCPGSCRMM